MAISEELGFRVISSSNTLESKSIIKSMRVDVVVVAIGENESKSV